MNYLDFYRMHSEPFPLIPEKGVFFEATPHIKAIEFITSSIDSNDIFILVIGHYGAGKTCLALNLLEVLERNNNIKKVIYVSTPNTPYNMLLKSIAGALNIKTSSNPSKELLQQKIYEYYEKNPKEKKRIVVLIDDVQEHNLSSLNEIKWTGNFHTKEGFFPFLFILFAHPSLIKRIESPDIGSFAQKMKKYFLGSLDLSETKEYIYFRLLNSGAKGYPYFPDNVISQIHAKTKGIPRQINILCDACLTVGASLGKKTIDTEILQNALNLVEPSELKIEEEKEEQEDKKNEKEIPSLEPEKPSEKPSDIPFSESTEQKKKDHALIDKIDIKKIEQKALMIFRILVYISITIMAIGGAIFVGSKVKHILWHKETQRKPAVSSMITPEESQKITIRKEREKNLLQNSEGLNETKILNNNSQENKDYFLEEIKKRIKNYYGKDNAQKFF